MVVPFTKFAVDTTSMLLSPATAGLGRVVAAGPWSRFQCTRLATLARDQARHVCAVAVRIVWPSVLIAREIKEADARKVSVRFEAGIDDGDSHAPASQPLKRQTERRQQRVW